MHKVLHRPEAMTDLSVCVCVCVSMSTDDEVVLVCVHLCECVFSAVVEGNSCLFLYQQHETSVELNTAYEACNVTPSPERKGGSETEMEMGGDSRQDGGTCFCFVFSLHFVMLEPEF